ncbi:MAG: hypothetical protein ACOX6K_02595 [Sphaerochaetaceae bacterium]|jgi:5'-methylthioadenosine/S-adenosylhomocysteine nucleosidase
MRVLVVASSASELSGLGVFSDGADFMRRILPCALGEIVGVPVGVGLVQAALGTCSAILSWKPDHVLCFGTAGAVRSDLGIGELVVADEVVQFSLDLRRFGLERGSTFGSDAGVVVGSVRPMLDLPQLPGIVRINGVVGSSDLFVTRRWREENPWLEEELHVAATDMESFAVAEACGRFSIPCCVARVVSDTASGRRPKNYRRFLDEIVADSLVSIIMSVKDRF